ncbi:YcjX family protein [Escherichia coli]|uniref:YcjX family protein n=1 Tax=Escherichia coli TaxID=562 RepID=UPI003CC909B6
MANVCERLRPDACRRKLLQTSRYRTDYLQMISRGCTLFSLGAFLNGRYGSCARAAITAVRMSMQNNNRNWRRPISTTMPECCAMRFTTLLLREGGETSLYGNHFLRFNRRCWLMSCNLSTLKAAFNDMRLALTQLIKSFRDGGVPCSGNCFRRLSRSLLFAATKAGPCDHRSKIIWFHYCTTDS